MTSNPPVDLIGHLHGPADVLGPVVLVSVDSMPRA
jgi:hypothetical protein